MRDFLSPDDLQELFGISKTTAYEVFKDFEKNGGRVIRLGKKHARSELLISFLESRANESKDTNEAEQVIRSLVCNEAPMFKPQD